jgi:insulysin
MEPLTKDDMIDFYKKHIDPNSPTRTKAAVHLAAQSDTKAAPNGTPEMNGTVPESEIRGGASTSTADGACVGTGPSDSKTVVIEDVKAFKASMPLTAGVRPIKDLSEFEELEAKL